VVSAGTSDSILQYAPAVERKHLVFFFIMEDFDDSLDNFDDSDDS
jgi:hypothetical protein